MPTTHVKKDERALDAALLTGELPALSVVDRVALRVGLTLILWGRHHAEQQDRTAAAHRAGDPERAATAARDAFERRTWSGTTL